MNAPSAHTRSLASGAIALVFFALGWGGSAITSLPSDTTTALCRESSGIMPIWYARAKRQCEIEPPRTDERDALSEACSLATTYEQLCRAVGSFPPVLDPP